LYNEASMSSSRIGAALRIGFNRTFTENSKVFWNISLAAGALYSTETNTLHSSKAYTNADIVLNQPYTSEDIIKTVSLSPL